MTRINLLPPEVKEKAAKPRLLPWFLLMGIVVIAVIAGLFFLFNSQKKSKEETLSQKKRELQELQKQTKPIETFEAQQKELESIKQLYDKTNAGKVAWAQMLNDLAMYVPEGLATASNPRAPSIWLTKLSIDAQPLEAAAGSSIGKPSGTPISMEGYAAPAWLCVQTWLPRASDFKAKGFLDAYPYYYYFKGHPKVAEFFVRLQNMEEWTNLWITDSKQETMDEKRLVPDATQPTGYAEESYSDWVIKFSIEGQWNTEKAIWKGTPATGGS